MSIKTWNNLHPSLWRCIAEYLDPRDAIALSKVAKFGKVAFERFFCFYFQNPLFKVYMEELAFHVPQEGSCASKLQFLCLSVIRDVGDIEEVDRVGELCKVAQMVEDYHHDFHFTHLQENQSDELQEYIAPNRALSRIPTPLLSFTQLTMLSFEGNNLSWLPEEFFTLSKLVWLNLSGNRLTFLSSRIGLLTCLENLDVSENQLTTLPEELDMENLIGLNLTGNPLRTIPEKLRSSKCFAIRSALGSFPLATGTRVGCVVS